MNAITPVPGVPDVYKSGVEGIGIKTLYAGSTSLTNLAALQWPVVTGAYNAYPFGPMGIFQVQLIVTGRVSGGAFNLPTPLAQMMYSALQVSVLNLVNNNASVVAPACTVQNSPIAVNLATVNFSGLPAIGATAGDKAFSVVLNCPATVSVSMTFTDVVAPDNRTNVLSLSKASSAAGVGYQIVYNAVPVNFGPDSSVAGNLNQVSIGTVSTGGVTIPFVARYVRTGKITPGSADANATFTMSYQ
jgi:type 1 fimbria pilin